MSQLKVGSIVPSGGLSSWAEAGGIIQVKQTTWTSTWSSSGFSMADITNASLSITPTSSSSKILIYYGVWACSNYWKTYINLVRGSTNLHQGAAAGSRPLHTSSLVDDSSFMNTHGPLQLHTIWYLDSPSTTSATTYKLQGSGRAGYYMRVNYTVPDRNTSEYDSRAASSLMAFEVSG